MRFVVNKCNKERRNYTMLLLTETDVESQSNEHVGAGYEILVLPSKYKDVHNDYLDTIRMLALVRRGQIIYV